jgi:hypothetical protein
MSNDNSPLRKLVLDALSSAKENGHEFAGWTSDEIALDMIDYDAEIAEYALDACGLIPHAFAEIVAIITEARHP